MGVEQACHPGHTGKAAVHDSLNNFGKGSKKYNNTKGGGGVISGLARLVQDYNVGPLQGVRVAAIGAEGRE